MSTNQKHLLADRRLIALLKQHTSPIPLSSTHFPPPKPDPNPHHPQPTLLPINERLLSFLNLAKSQSHIGQIQTQLILHSRYMDTTLAHHFISVSNSFSLLPSLLPLFLSHSPSTPHLFIFNTLLKFLSQSCPSHLHHLPFVVYTHMRNASISPNNFTFPFLLKSLSESRDVLRGRFVHAHVVKLGHLCDVYVGNSLMDLYSSCGEISSCRKVFDEMPLRDHVTWTVLIMGYRDSRMYDYALVAFESMWEAGLTPNRATLVVSLPVCARLGAIRMGRWIHGFVRRGGCELDVKLGTSLIDMYMRCGRIDEGLSVFTEMVEKNVYTWNVVIKGFALAKCKKESVLWFVKMEREGIKADQVTLVNVLSACSQLGLVCIAEQIFSSLVVGKFGFPPSVKHYACMVDLLARAGCLDAAFKLIGGMPFLPTKPMWGALLDASRSRGDFDLSELAAKMLVQLEPGNGAYYAVLSNVYAEMGRWSDVAEVRELMKVRGLNKDLGCSTVEREYRDSGYDSVVMAA